MLDPVLKVMIVVHVLHHIHEHFDVLDVVCQHGYPVLTMESGKSLVFDLNDHSNILPDMSYCVDTLVDCILRKSQSV